jgi:hypothetical protein
VTVRVTDNGSPAASDTETLTLTVNEVNAAPVILPIGDKTVAAGTALSFPISATDGDEPVQTLLFSLDAGAPAGASVDAASGRFTWKPAATQAGRTYPITVRVTDDGTPPLSAALAFQVNVTGTAEGVRIRAVRAGGGSVQLAWDTTPGQTYQVQYTDDLEAGRWMDLGEPIVGDGSAAQVDDAPNGDRRRFYRIVALP